MVWAERTLVACARTGAACSVRAAGAGVSSCASAPDGPKRREIHRHAEVSDPAPYDIDEHTGYKQIFDGKSLTGWDADPTIWRVEDGVMVGETLEGKPKGNNYIVYRGDKTRDFDLKLQMKIEKGGGGGIQYRSVTGVPWTRPQPAASRPMTSNS